MDDSVAFARLLEALRPWLRHLVIVGGWAHRLHRFHPLSHPPAYAALRTRDADIAFDASAPLTGDIAAALQARGFHETLSGEHTPPVTHYRLRDNEQGFFAEFLTPLHGDGTTRQGRPDATMAKAGVTAQKLRHLDVLLIQPWTVRLSRDTGVPVTAAVDVKLANPVTFIAQKLLIQKHRKSGKQAQDALYIHDTLELFGGELAALKAIWQQEIHAALPRQTAQSVRRLARERFAEVTDVLRDAARIPQDRTLRPERMQALCAYGVADMFDS